MTGRITAWRLGGLGLGRRDAGLDDVVVPLEQAHLHSHSARCGRTEYEEVPGSDEEAAKGLVDEEEFGEDDRHEATGMLEMRAAEYSVEGLRKEVRKGAGGTRSEYESECRRLLDFGKRWMNGWIGC